MSHDNTNNEDPKQKKTSDQPSQEHQHKPQQEPDSIMQFPCEFTFKVFGKPGDAFENAVKQAIDLHFKDLPADSWQERPSKDHNYVAISITVTAKSKAQLDDVYRQLSADPHVVMAL